MKLILAPLFAAGAALAFVAQPPLAEFSNLTATAILGWYAWHTATKTLPQLVENFRRELAAERALHRTDREAFLREMAAERAERRADHGALQDSVDALAQSIKSLTQQAIVPRTSGGTDKPSACQC
jgi:acyl carrier protein phosphodiesterase